MKDKNNVFWFPLWLPFLFLGMLFAIQCSPVKKPSKLAFLEGEWTMRLEASTEDVTFGSARFDVHPCGSHFTLNGELKNIETGKNTTIFDGIAGTIIDNRIFFIYENDAKECGIARGRAPKPDDKSFGMQYLDAYGCDRQGDPSGTIYFSRE